MAETCTHCNPPRHPGDHRDAARTAEPEPKNFTAMDCMVMADKHTRIEIQCICGRPASTRACCSRCYQRLRTAEMTPRQIKVRAQKAAVRAKRYAQERKEKQRRAQELAVQTKERIRHANDYSTLCTTCLRYRLSEKEITSKQWLAFDRILRQVAVDATAWSKALAVLGTPRCMHIDDATCTSWQSCLLALESRKKTQMSGQVGAPVQALRRGKKPLGRGHTFPGKYNAARDQLVFRRRAILLSYFLENNIDRPWWQGALLAKGLGVSRATICRDLSVIFGGLDQRRSS